MHLARLRPSLSILLPVLLPLALGPLACAPSSIKLGEDTGRPRPDADADTDADSDTDTHADADADTDTDADSDTDADTDADTDTAPPPPTDPTSCADLLAREPSAMSGVHTIDPDGPAGKPPFDVICDMDTDGGGWTLWWWFLADRSVDWRTVSDVLGSDLADCSTTAKSCFAHIPDASVNELRAFDGTDWATWTFDPTNRTSQRAYNAFVKLQESGYELDLHLDVWNPVRQSSVSRTLTNPYACDADNEISSDGDCRNFWYQDANGPYGTVRSFNLDDDGGYGQTALAGGTDNATDDVGCDFLEQSVTTTNRQCTGALYYR